MYKGVEPPPIKEARGSNNDTDLHTNDYLTSHEALGDILKQKGCKVSTIPEGIALSLDSFSVFLFHFW